MGREQKEKRRGGARDDSEIYISYTRDRLLRMIVCREAKMGVIYPHDFCLPVQGAKVFTALVAENQENNQDAY